MKLSTTVTVVTLLWASASAAQDGGVTSDVAKAIRGLRAARSAERIEAARVLSAQSSDVVPALLPWTWGCGRGTEREGATPGVDCAHLNEAVYQVLGVLSAIARREPASCEPSCPARMALFTLTTAQGGIDWDQLPLEDDDSQLPAAVRGPALAAYAKTQFRQAFPLPEWRERTASPAARAGTTSIYLSWSTTQPSMYTACALALYVENERGRVGKLVERDAQSLGLSCELGKVEAAVTERPDVLAVVVNWVPLGDAFDKAQTLLMLQLAPGQVKLLCSVSEAGTSDLLARRAKLVHLRPRGCVDARGTPIGRQREVSTLPR